MTDVEPRLSFGTTWPSPRLRRSSPRTAGSCRSCAGCSPTARRRSASTASSRKDAPGHLPARVGRAGRHLVALLVRRRRARRATLTERRRPGALARHGRRRACPTDGSPLDALATPSQRSRPTPQSTGLPPLTGGMVGFIGVGRGAPARAAARQPPPTTRRARVSHDARDRPRRCSTTATAPCCSSPTPSTTTRPTSGSRTPGPTRVARLDAMTSGPRAAAPSTVADGRPRDLRRAARARCQRHHPGRLRGAVEQAKEDIRAGDVFQVVISQRFDPVIAADAARRLPRAAHAQPEPLHVPAAPRPGDGTAYDDRRLVAGGAGQGARTAGRSPTRSPARGRAARPRRTTDARRRAAGRPQGAGRAPHARRPRPQRPAAGLRAGHASR